MSLSSNQRYLLALLMNSVLSVGDSRIGKTCLMKRFCEERFETKYIGTIGVDYGVKRVSVEGVELRVNFWDLSGEPNFFEIRNEFYSRSHGVLMCFDLNSVESFENLDAHWLEELRKYGDNDHSVVALVGTRSDLGRREVSPSDAQAYADSNDWMYFETSAMSGEGVPGLFMALFRRILTRIREEEEEEEEEI